MTVPTVVNLAGAPVRTQWLERVARRAIRAARAKGKKISVTIAILSEAPMRRLHQRSLGDPSATDVLSYPLYRKKGTLHGEIAVCWEAARREARRRGHSLHAELALYTVHGILHLVGYDDHTKKARRRMWARQAEILSGLGIRLRS